MKTKMATAALEYNLDNHEDGMAFTRAVKSTDMALALFEITCNLKRKVSRQLEAGNTSNEDPLDIVFAHIDTILEEHNISIDELVD